MKGTPFRTSGRVSGEDFFGRSELIRAVIRNLRAKNSVAIVGTPRMGRTSLITLLFRNYKRAERNVLTWFADLRELETMDDLVEEFYIGIGAQTKSHSLNALVKTLKVFEKRLIMFIDSAERFAEPPFNEEALFAVLSSYLPSQHVTLCIATTVRPELMLTNRIGFSLHAQFVTLELPPLTVDECEELIQKKLQWTGVRFSQPEIDGLIRESKGHPADLQRLAAELFVAKTESANMGKPQTIFTSERQRK
ncbi:MAG: hypothetical protein AB1817_13230 [Chloroflexota bacterium]